MVKLKNVHENIYFSTTVKGNVQAEQTVNNRQKKRKELINRNTGISKYYVA
jgi:hypothetical protein